MSDQSSLISSAFQTFLSEAPQQAQAWGASLGRNGSGFVQSQRLR